MIVHIPAYKSRKQMWYASGEHSTNNSKQQSPAWNSIRATNKANSPHRIRATKIHVLRPNNGYITTIMMQMLMNGLTTQSCPTPRTNPTWTKKAKKKHKHKWRHASSVRRLYEASLGLKNVCGLHVGIFTNTMNAWWGRRLLSHVVIQEVME